MNEEEQGSQVGEALKQAGKDALKNGAKQGFKQLGKIIISFISPALSYIFGAVLAIAIIGVGIDWLVDAFTVEASAQAAQTSLVENTTIENGKWKIDPKVYEKILKQLKQDGLTLYGFDEGENTVNAENVAEITYKDLKKLVEAEFASTHPKLSEGDELGTITFIRRSYEDETETVMTYMDYTEFHEKINANDYDAVRNKFTLKEETSTVQIEGKEKTEKKYIAEFAKCTIVNDEYTVTAEQYNYEMLVANYVTPLEFMVANLQMSNSKDYVLAIADMVANNSKIEICIQEQYNRVEETPVEEWYEKVYLYKVDDQGHVDILLIKSKQEESIGTTTVTETITILPYIKKIDTWMAKAEQVYNKKETTTGPERVGQTRLTDSDEWKGNIRTVKTNRKKYTVTKTHLITYVKGVTTTDESN